MCSAVQKRPFLTVSGRWAETSGDKVKVWWFWQAVTGGGGGWERTDGWPDAEQSWPWNNQTDYYVVNASAYLYIGCASAGDRCIPNHLSSRWSHRGVMGACRERQRSENRAHTWGMLGLSCGARSLTQLHTKCNLETPVKLTTCFFFFFLRLFLVECAKPTGHPFEISCLL